ncbi:hypothetical protein FLJC2902T_14540 [Flavobacterium limnosediminis JC2902]|uniref:Uncharacterized protein n=1 Tax=Flavobacterium limnosediminis JC2902 TaxID=1341181 RepID=V6SRP3_9FLAO|nr:hypothetical protein FLJC2902T_14540 [Flavobacterium limnosediminis JC2902]
MISKSKYYGAVFNFVVFDLKATLSKLVKIHFEGSKEVIN